MAKTIRIDPKILQTGGKIRVAAYCRVSSNSADQLNSYARQISVYGRMHPEYYGCALIDKMLDEGLLSMDDAKYYAVASRDVGNEILSFITKHKPEGMKFYTDDYLSDMTMEGDWQIEGMFLVDLDEQSAEIWWHGLGVEFPFKQLVNYSDDDLSKDMKRLEDGDIGEGVGEGVRTPTEEIGGMEL